MEELTAQDQEFVKEVAITGNQTQAAKKAYGIKSDDYARKKGSVQVAKGNISTAITEVKKSLAERIPDELLEQRHLELLNKRDKFIVKDAETGAIQQEVDMGPETTSVSKGLDMAYKLKGAYAPEKSISLNMNAEIANPKARELAEKYEEELKKNL